MNIPKSPFPTAYRPRINIVGSGDNERRVATYYDPKPGSLRGPDPYGFDWEAVAEDYDPECDPVGYGSSEENAIADLLTQLEEREE